MTTVEKIFARSSGRSAVSPGDIVVVPVETTVLIDMIFLEHIGWRWPKKLYDPSKVVLVADHLVLSTDRAAANALQVMRMVAKHYGIERYHAGGRDQGISHQIVADKGYALPGTVLANGDSHAISGGAANCLARGLGTPELLHILCTGQTWFRADPTVRYELQDELPPGVTMKDVFLFIADKWGAHENLNIEFGGPAQAGLSFDARRTLTTMCAELSAEFATWDPDDALIEFIGSKTDREFFPTWPDRDASYVDVRTINLAQMEPYVSGADTVVRNARPLDSVREKVRLDQCVVGSCANGTLDDLKSVARVLAGREVAPHVRFIVTPASQAIYRQAEELGIIGTIIAAGALVTPSACGACAAQGVGALAAGDVCLTSTTRNYKGRMGSPQAKIYMASPATVAASAVAGYIADPRRLDG